MEHLCTRSTRASSSPITPDEVVLSSSLLTLLKIYIYIGITKYNLENLELARLFLGKQLQVTQFIGFSNSVLQTKGICRKA